MLKLSEYKQHADECRKMAGKKASAQTWEMLATERQ
jgi:hypothetical protein